MIDNREPTWIKNLNFGGDVSVSNTIMEAGDFWIAADDGSLLVVERKTPNDFLGTLAGDRLFVQMAGLVAMRKTGAWPYLLITGEFRQGPNGKVYTDRETGWDWKAVQGALLSVQEMGVFVTFCAGDTDVEERVDPAIKQIPQT